MACEQVGFDSEADGARSASAMDVSSVQMRLLMPRWVVWYFPVVLTGMREIVRCERPAMWGHVEA